MKNLGFFASTMTKSNRSLQSGPTRKFIPRFLQQNTAQKARVSGAASQNPRVTRRPGSGAQSAPSDRARPHSRGDHLATIVGERSAHSWHSGRCSGGAPFEQRPAGHYTGPLVMRRPPIRLYYKRRVRYARRSRHFLSHDRGGPENSSASCDARRQMAPRAHAHWRQ